MGMDYLGLIPEEYCEKLKSLYENLPHDGLNYSSNIFLFCLGYKIYTETVNEDKGNNFSNFNSGAFRNYVNDEIRFALERRGFKFNKNNLEGISFDYHNEVRDQVLKGLVIRCISFFKDIENNATLKNKKLRTKEKLKCSLRNWIER